MDVRSMAECNRGQERLQSDYGKILSYRSAAGFGVRLDGAMGDTGSIITPFYDSLLVKLTTTFESHSSIGSNARALRKCRSWS